MAQTSWDRGELPLGLGVNVGALVKGTEELILLVGVGAE